MTTAQIGLNSCSQTLGPLFVDTFHDEASWEECQKRAEQLEKETQKKLEEANTEFALREEKE